MALDAKVFNCLVLLPTSIQIYLKEQYPGSLSKLKAPSADRFEQTGLHPFRCTKFQVFILNNQRQAARPIHRRSYF